MSPTPSRTPTGTMTWPGVATASSTSSPPAGSWWSAWFPAVTSTRRGGLRWRRGGPAPGRTRLLPGGTPGQALPDRAPLGRRDAEPRRVPRGLVHGDTVRAQDALEHAPDPFDSVPRPLVPHVGVQAHRPDSPG